MAVKLICAHCKDTFCLDDDDDTLESGMTLTCTHCRKDTIVELFRPEDRKQLYKIAYKTGLKHTGKIPQDLLESTGPSDPTGSVRKALEEERGK